MANKILIKRSASQGSIPNVNDLSLGELAINTFDGRIFTKKDDGTAGIIDLKRNDPIRVLGDATSTYAWDQGTYTSNVTVALINSGVSAGSYGAKTASTIQNGGNIQIPTFSVHANGIVYSAGTVSIAASDFGTMAVQDSNNVNITGGNITGVSVSITGGEASFSNVTVTGTLYSNDITAATVTVDGDAIITGNLQVQGTQTIVNSTTVAVGDLNILLAKDATNATQATGAGITVAGPATQANIVYNGTSDSWNLNKDTNITGAVSVTGLATLNGGIAVDTNKFTVEDGSGNTAIAGTLTVTDLATFNGGITADGGKFTVADSTGNIHTDGTLDVDSNATINGTLTVDQLTNLNGGIAVDTNKFTVADNSGNTNIAGTLDVDGAVNLNSTLMVDGLATLDGGIQILGVNAGQVWPEFAVDASSANVSIRDAWLVFQDTFSGAGTTSYTTKMVINGNTGDVSTEGNVTVNGTLAVNGGVSFDSGAFTIADATGDIHTNGNLDVDQNTTINGTLTVDGFTTLNGGISLDSGAFTIADVTGDIHTSGNLDVDQNTTLNGTLTVDALASLNGGIAVDTNKFTVADGTGDTYIDGTLDVKGDLTTDDVVANGVVFGDNVSGALTTDAEFTYNSTTNTLTTGNIVATGNVTVQGNISVGDLTISGVASLSGGLSTGNVAATQVVFGDNTTGTLKGESTFTYNETTDTLSVGNVTVADDVAINGGDLTTTAATFNLVNANATTVNFAGAATTVAVGAAGGAGVLTIKNDNVVLDGDLQIKGGDLTTNQTTFNLLNATATTLNVGGAATAVNIGAAGGAGTLTIKNDNVVLDGDLQVKGGDITTNQTTFNLLNATATTINFGGAATTVEIGAGSGTTTINNNGQVDGTLNVTGNVSVATNKFNITASSGDTAIAGTLGITGATTLQNTLDVTGAATFANVVSLITANAQMTLSNYSTGSLRVLGDVSVDGKIQASGPIYKAGFEVLNTQDTIDGGTY